ncbi:hypothetical protein LUW77_03575 [Streptomyces radiopugnans]|nr:hypothetical protein LUW77_03575 [Streptomyces radiopugnans]
MPTTDSYGQGVQIASLTDAPDAAKLARDLADGLVPRSNLRFADAAERNATITAPAASMEAWLKAEKLKTVYDGTNWVVMAAGTSSWTTPTLVSGFAHNGNNNGTFQYRVVNLFGERALMLRGAVSVTYSPSIPNSGILMASPLPTSARPSVLRTVNIPCSDVGSTRISLKLDIKTDGHLEIFGTNSTDNRPAWIGFNGTIVSL